MMSSSRFQGPAARFMGSAFASRATGSRATGSERVVSGSGRSAPRLLPQWRQKIESSKRHRHL